MSGKSRTTGDISQFFLFLFDANNVSTLNLFKKIIVKVMWVTTRGWSPKPPEANGGWGAEPPTLRQFSSFFFIKK